MNKEAIDMIRKGLSMLDGDVPMDEAKKIQNDMDMGGESPNKPNLEDDAINKDQGNNAPSEMKKKAFVAMMRKKGM